MDNLKYIRRTLERAGSFTAVPGKGGMLMGVVALLAARLAAGQPSAGGWLAIWTGAAIIALAIGIAGAALKSRRFQMPLFSGPGRKFIAGFTPAIVAGAVMTAVFYRAGISGFLPGVWLLLYGAAVLAGGSASVRRAAFDFRNRHRGEIWRVNKTQCGAIARDVRLWRPWAMLRSLTAWSTNACAWEFSARLP